METRTQKILSRHNNKISIDITPGHFVTSHSHINYCVDLTNLKTDHRMAQAGANVLSKVFSVTAVDTILCLEETKVVGAFLAEALTDTLVGVNAKKSIRVVTPEFNAAGQMFFRDNTKAMVAGQHVLLLLASASTGKTVKQAMECLEYYGGQLTGVGALFSGVNFIDGTQVHSLFTVDDLPGYRSYASGECAMCQQKQKVDAIVNSYGYSKL